jgi:hypothetical protein
MLLYSPAVAFTLVSIGHCDDAGFTFSYGNGHCIVNNPNGNCCAIIPKVNGMYCTTHKRNPSVAIYSNVCMVMSVNDLHARMGHILPASAKHMIKQGTVKGIELDDSPLPNFCNACIKWKFTRKPIPRQCTSKHAISQGAKVYTDVWAHLQSPL